MPPAETRLVRAFIDRVPALSMILERPHARPEIAIVARHHAAFAAGGHDLVLAEGPGADMADRPDAAPLVARAMRLRAILDHLDTARGGEVHDRVPVTGPARAVTRYDPLGERTTVG